MISSSPVYLIGAGSLGRVVLSHLLEENSTVDGFFDDNPDLCGNDICGVKVLGAIEDLLSIKKICKLYVCIADNVTKLNIVKMLSRNTNFIFRSFVSKRALLSGDIQIGKGSILFPGCNIDPFVNIGNFVVINKNVSVGHDTCIDDFTTVSPGVSLGGKTKLMKGSFIGMNAVILPGIRIGEFAAVGAGAVVTKPVKEKTLVVGVPAVEKKEDM